MNNSDAGYALLPRRRYPAGFGDNRARVTRWAYSLDESSECFAPYAYQGSVTALSVQPGAPLH